ncbi:flavin reductase family protein [Saccharothrix sp. SC076]|nr:flavin reductase family protein [Saccharothrix obliqua]
MVDRTRRLRDCLGHFPTGVTVVTTERDGVVHGATVGSFTSVSLDPPLVLVSLRRTSTLGELLSGAPFCVNVLASDQRELALHFAGARTTEVTWLPGAGPPRLAGCAAFVSCAPWAGHDGGDHVLHLGEVVDFGASGAEPLVFHRGAFREMRRARAETGWSGSLDYPTEMLAAMLSRSNGESG